MPTYVILLKWTDEGAKTAKDAPDRIARIREMWTKFGAKLKDFYFTFGRYDMIAIVEAPNDEAMAKAVVTGSGWGAARYETMRAFSEAEGADIIRGR